MNWIEDYISVEVVATVKGKTMKATSKNDTLNLKQKRILNEADIGTSILCDVAYTYPNVVTGNPDLYKVNISVMIVPETQAEYLGGYNQLSKYLKENIINKIRKTFTTDFQAIVTFRVNEDGLIDDAKILNTSGNQNIDKLLVEGINKMPKWKPAMDANGVKVRQEFEFTVGNEGC